MWFITSNWNCYCWGKLDFIKLKTKNESFKKLKFYNGQPD